jgi:hypothetical protein
MIAGIGLLIFAVATQVTFMGVVAFIVMVIGLVVASSNFRLPELPKTNFQSGGGSFFEDRWNNRFNND